MEYVTNKGWKIKKVHLLDPVTVEAGNSIG